MDDVSITLYIPLLSYQKIMGYADVCDTEITGFADVTFDDDRNGLVVGEVFLLEQVGAASEVEMSEESIGKFTNECMKKGMTQLPRLWWHSHVNMGAFFSGTDEQAMKDLKNESWSVALVVNKKEEMKATLNLYQPVELQVTDLPVVVLYPKYGELEELRTEVEQKVTKKKFSLPAYTGKHNKGKGQGRMRTQAP